MHEIYAFLAKRHDIDVSHHFISSVTNEVTLRSPLGRTDDWRQFPLRKVKQTEVPRSGSRLLTDLMPHRGQAI